MADLGNGWTIGGVDAQPGASSTPAPTDLGQGWKIGGGGASAPQSLPPTREKMGPPAGPQILEEEPPHAPTVISTKIGRVAAPPETTDRQLITHFLLSPPPLIGDAVKELNQIMVGPFQIQQKAIVEPLASMTSPAGLATAAVGGGLAAGAASSSARVAAGSKGAQVALSAFFAGQQAKQLAQEVPEAYEKAREGDYWGALGDMGAAGTSAFLGTLAAMHAHGELSDLETLGATKRALQSRLNAEEFARSAAEKTEASRQAAARPKIEGPAAISPAPIAAQELGKGWTIDPATDPVEAKLEATIQPQEQAEIAKRVTPAAVPAPTLSETPQAVAPPMPAVALGNGWTTAAPSENRPSSAALPDETAAPAERGPGWIGNIPRSEINVDAPRFQFKQNVGQGGVGDEFREVTHWDPEKAGILSVWKDPVDGKTYAVNGHHRVDMANRADNAPDTMPVRYLDAKTAEEARTKGALINIAEGHGESTDAAKVFRSMPIHPEMQAEFARELGKGKVATEGLALSKLAQPIFDDVMSGDLTAARGAVLGSGIANPTDQQAVYDLMKQQEKGGRRLTNDQVAELIDLNSSAPTKTESSADAAQGGLFGVEEMTRSLLPEKAVVSEYIRKQLGVEKRLFGTVGTQAAAERLGESGNVIKAGENAAQAQNANQGMVLYDKLKSKAGPIAQTLDRAAQALADGESPNEVKQRAYKEIRSGLRSQIDQLRGIPEVGPRGVEGLGGQGPLQSRRPVGTSELDRQQQSFVTPEAEAQSRTDSQHSTDKLLGDRLTAQIRSGMPAKSAMLKPAQTGSLFDQAGPEQGSLFKLPKGPAYRPGLSRAEKLSESQIVAGAAKTGEPVLQVNGQTMDLLHEALGIQDENIPGAAFTASQAQQILSHSKTERSKALLRGDKAAAAKWGAIRDAIEENRAASGAGPMAAVSEGSALQEELNHLEQLTATGDEYLNHLGVDGTKAFFAPGSIGERAAGVLMNTYPDAHPAQLVMEIGVRLMEEGRYRELNLTPQERDALAGQYEDLLIARHGTERTAKISDKIKAARGTGPEGEYERGLPTSQTPDQGRRGLGAREPEGTPQGEAAGRPGEASTGAGSGGRGLPEVRGEGPLQSRALSGSPAFTGRLAEQDKQYALNVREWFTSRRDIWGARVNQVLEELRKVVPDPVYQEALSIYRDFKSRPGELAQWLNGTHPAYGDVERVDHARENIEKLRPAIERAMNPTPEMIAADEALTRIAEVSLAEGQKLGFIDRHVKPEEYVTHLLAPETEGGEPTLGDRVGRALGGKIGRNFPYNQQRSFPTLLDAAANNFSPRTLNALGAFHQYADKFATARATHLLIEQLRASNVGIWGTKSDKGIPRDWVEIAPHAHPFRNLIGYSDEAGEPQGAYQTLFVPPVVEAALRPITDPDYTGKIAGFTKLRVFQSYTKAAQLSLSYFHATSENYMALANMGARGWLKALKTDRSSPEFLEQERDLIGHGGTTSIQGKTFEAYTPPTVSSLPTWSEAWRGLPGIRQIDQAARGITEFTFGRMQRQFKVVDYATHKAAWLAEHPHATPTEENAALRSIAKEVNAVYGGLHAENLGINKSTVEVARALMLAPDWTISNIFNLKYAMERGTPAGKMARMFWLRAIVGGLVATQAASLMFTGKPSKRPTQAYMGTDRDGKEIYQNLFFKGAPGDIATMIGNVKDYGAAIGLMRTVGNKAAPVWRTGIQAITDKNFFGQAIVPKGMNPVVGTVRGTYELAKGMAPVPWAMSNAKDMLFGPESGKYKVPLEVLTTLFAGTPPSHVSAKPEKTAQNMWEQIKTGKVSAPAARPAANPLQQMRREHRKLLKGR